MSSPPPPARLAVLSALLCAGCGAVVEGVEPAAWDAVVVADIGDAVPVDARTAEEFAAGHVPGAAQIHWTELTGPDAEGRWGAAAPEDAAALLAARGVPFDAPVVIYGSGPGGYGDDGNVYWMLRWLGHPDVRILDGGWLAWVAGDGPVETGDALPPPVELDPAAVVHTLDDQVHADTDDVAAWDGLVLDVRTYEEYQAGHVPGAVWMEWTEVFAPDETLLPPDELRALFRDVAGLDPDTPVVTYCAGGIRAGHTFMVLDALGQPTTANYVGSWARWTAEGGPVATP